MVLEGADSAFGGIAAVHTWWNKLEVDFLLVHKVLQELGAFVVEALELGLESSLCQVCMQNLVGIENAFGSAVLERLG